MFIDLENSQILFLLDNTTWNKWLYVCTTIMSNYTKLEKQRTDWLESIHEYNKWNVTLVI